MFSKPSFYLERRREPSCAASLSLQSVLAQLPALCEGVQPSSSIAFREVTGLMESEDSKHNSRKSESIDEFLGGEGMDFCNRQCSVLYKTDAGMQY